MEIITEKIMSLQRELEALLRSRDALNQHLKDNEVRIHQVSGAIDELNSILTQLVKENNKDETGKTD